MNRPRAFTLNKKRAALLSLTGFLLVTTMSNPISQGFRDKGDSASPNFLSIFTNFLSNPPIIAKLKYSQNNHLLMNNSGFYEAKWQPGAIYLRKGSTMAELLPNGGTREEATLSLAQYGSNSYSMLIGNQYLEVLTAETQKDPSKSKVEREALQRASPVLNLGLLSMRPGSVSFDDNLRFQGVTIHGAELKGTLNLSNNVPAEMVMQLTADGKDYTWKAAYSYDGSGPEIHFLPRVIKLWYSENSEMKPFSDFTLQSCETNSTPLPNSEFTITQFTNNATIVIHRDPELDQKYYFDSYGNKQYLVFSDEEKKGLSKFFFLIKEYLGFRDDGRQEKKGLSRPFFLIIVIIALALLLSVAFSIATITKKKSSPE